ncbi:MAG: hypothetical protein IPG80_21665 [Anaerolineales bacterium]|jgi:hypothetical protein|uniref:hypothetical protein n=1 Tax=Candidatus Villigracilis vicinus TaxID=3140679 RepID=UPI0031358FB1|nr:hypothetical protein [Anaerolineales bacterium]MBK7450034.1 hypothetical protein [Anaerolineales bacterium]MBK9779733.1 hypothetical protein [Anaerolineales bacterium]
MISSTSTTCYVHPNRETSLRCKRCDRYICTSCAVSTPTGYICKECMRERQRSFDTALWYDFISGAIVAGVISGVASFLVTLIGGFGFFGWILIFLGSSAAGTGIAEAVRAITHRRRSRALFITVGAGVIAGALPMLLLQLLGGNIFGIIFQALYLFVSVPLVYARLSGIQLSR